MKRDMTAGKEGKSILLFSLPIMGANFLQVLYGFADSVIVGNYVSSTALGAIGLTTSMTALLVYFCSGLGSGLCVAVSQFFGARREREIKELISTGFVMAFLLSFLLTVLCFFLSRPVIFGFLQTPANMGEGSLLYFRIYSCGLLFQMLYNAAYAVLRAHGDSRGALFFLLISSALNILLDLLFVVVFRWGIAGAAVATVISQAGSAVASLIYLGVLFPDLLPRFKYLGAWKEKSWLITRLSVPIIFQSMINTLGFIVLQRLVNSFGEYSIEGYAAMQRIENLAHIPSNSLNSALSSFTGQNIGAQRLDRAKRGYHVTIRMGIIFSLILGALVILFDEQLLQMFNITGESLRRGREHLDLLMLFIWAATIRNISCGFLQGAGDVKLPMLSGFVNLGTRLLLSYALAGTVVDFRCFYVSMPPAWLLATLIVVLRYRSGKWERFRVAK
ncbi:MAG: MATE family efflux transporter [Bacillota bacterium]|nr:MATE family efflux transporter [Bacillota bacterium]